MTEPRPRGLVEGTLADLVTLMQEPVWPRRGNTYLAAGAQPAAGAGFTYKVDSAWWERIVSLYFQFAAAAGGTARQVAINLLGADGQIFNSTPALVQVQGGETWIVSADLAGTPGQPGASGSAAQGVQTSPAALTTIAQVTVGAGVWTVAWNVSLSGTVAAPEANNFQLSGPTAGAQTSDNPAVAGGPWQQNPATFEIGAGGGVIKVRNIALATVGAVYDAAFTATPAGSTTSYPQLPNIVLKSAWQAQIAVAGIQAGDQLSAIQILTERYPSNWADGSLRLDEEQLIRGMLA